MRATLCSRLCLLVTAVVTCATLLLGHPVFASPERLFTIDSGPPSKAFEGIAVAGALERYDVTLDPRIVADDPIALEIALPDGRVLNVARDLFLVDDAGFTSWVGTPRAGDAEPAPADAYLHLVHHGDHVTGILNHGADRYRLLSAGPGLHQLVRLAAGPPSCAFESQADTSASSHAGASSFGGSPVAPASAAPIVPADQAPLLAEPQGPGAKATTQIDLLAVYTNGFSGAAETAVRDFIEDSVAIANTGFVRSQVSARYRLVHMAKLTGAQPSGNGLVSSWQWINTEPTEVKNLRDAYGADMVTLFVPLSFNADNFCGIANVPQSNGNILPLVLSGQPTVTIPGPFGQRAFTVNRSGCGLNDLTLGHELGHNYGMLHAGSDPLRLFSFASGHTFSVSGTQKASAMQCIRIAGPITGAVCTRVNNFSNPNVTLGGSATGTATRDNARVATLQKAPYAAFRSPEVGTCTPTSTRLCLLKNRFRVEVDFVDGGVTKTARTKTFSDETGLFWFFSAANLEVGVKVLDGRAINNRFWVYHGAMTNLQYTVKVTDTIKGTVRTYLRPATGSSVICGGSDTGAFVPQAPPGFLEQNDTEPETIGVLAFPAGTALQADRGTQPVRAACTPTSKRLCLLGNRFQVEVKRNNVAQNGFELTDQTGLFTFFSTTNGEVPVKVLDGRSFNGKFWVFFGSMTDQSYQVIVKDTVTNITKTYTSPQASCGRADTAAF